MAAMMSIAAMPMPTHAPAGQCGLSGLEGLLPLLGMLIRKRLLKKRGEVA